MPSLTDLIRQDAAPAHGRAWSRGRVDAASWTFAATQLAEGRLTLLDLWGETDAVHMALLDEPGREIGIVSLACPDGRYPSVGQRHLPAIRLERAIHDLYGLEATGLPDTRPWLDHGRWDLRHPLGSDPSAAADASDYRFLPVEGDSLHQIPVGPVHAGIIEPGHFRFTASGETVVRLEERLGYAHKGIEGLIAGTDLARAALLTGRVSGDSAVAYALAFARAVEDAVLGVAPARAVWLRALMAELERIANHLGDVGAICNDAAFGLMHAHCGILRERVLRAANQCFGHRLMRDRIVLGGVTIDINPDGVAVLRDLVVEIRRRFPPLVELYDATASLQDRTVGTGVLKAALARQFGVGGFVGRASERVFDARRLPGYAPYDALTFDVPVFSAGDVNARVWVRIREIEQSLALVDQILETMPSGPIRAELPVRAGEGMALVEGFRGDVLVWLRLSDDGTVARCRLRDPSWFQWPLLEAVIEGNIVADFPLCNKSFNCSYSGHDL